MISKLILISLLSVFISYVKCDTDSDLMKQINQIDNEKSVPLFGGLSIDRIDTWARENSGRSVQSFVDRAIIYMKTHKLNFQLPIEEDGVVEEARTGKLKKLALPLLLALKFKFAIILPIILAGIALISVKGLVAGTLALLFSAGIFFKDLLSKKREHITTAYISGPSPIKAEIVQHQDWNRSGLGGIVPSAQELAYNYHTLPQQI